MKDFLDQMNLTQISLEISDISYECFLWKIPNSQDFAGLITFSGTYRNGSNGFDDALFIKWKINEFCEVETPFPICGLVVDFSELIYEWGDDLTVSAKHLRLREQPIRIVVSLDRYKAFEGVLDVEELRTDINIAFSEVIEKAQS
jgi:hypothetical protein